MRRDNIQIIQYSNDFEETEGISRQKSREELLYQLSKEMTMPGREQEHAFSKRTVERNRPMPLEDKGHELLLESSRRECSPSCISRHYTLLAQTSR